MTEGLYIRDEVYEAYLLAKEVGLVPKSEYDFCNWLLEGNELELGKNIIFTEKDVLVVEDL